MVFARINRELFEWVIENLMKNALDAMEGSDGKIGFALSRASGRGCAARNTSPRGPRGSSRTRSSASRGPSCAGRWR